MSTYLDVRVARIQQYLDRSTALYERRFASYAVVAATNEATIHEDLPDLVAHGEAGQIDGVLHLRVDGLGSSPRDPEVVAVEALAWVRERLPEAHLRAWWCEADSYEQASTQARAQEASGTANGASCGSLVWLPAPNELPIARRCEACGAQAALSEHEQPGQDSDPGARLRWLCADCEIRQAGRLFRWRGTHQPVPVPTRERELQNALMEKFGSTLKLARDFTDLHPNWDPSTSVGARRDDTPTGRGAHHATIAFDGNAFGAVFSAVRDVQARRALAGAVSDALTTALVTSGTAIHDPADRTVLVQAHIQGGDDLLVTVWAPRAWDFVLSFLDTFDQLSANAIKEIYLEGVATPALSAGVVFAHDSFPFAYSREIAEDLLSAAKREHPAPQSTIGWLDVTEDGDLPVPGRRGLLLGDAHAWDDRIVELATIPHSQRAALRDAAGAGRVLAQAQRTGYVRQVEPFLQADTPLRLLDALTLTRWWPHDEPTN